MNKREEHFNKLWDVHMATLTPQQKIEFIIDQLNRLAGFPPGQGWVALEDRNGTG